MEITNLYVLTDYLDSKVIGKLNTIKKYLDYIDYKLYLVWHLLSILVVAILLYFVFKFLYNQFSLFFSI